MEAIRMIIIDSDNETRYNIKNYLSEVSYIRVNKDFDNYAEGFAYAVNEKPDLILIDIGQDREAAFEFIEKISIQLRSCIIFVTATDASPDTILRAMRAGAREFLLKPLQPVDIRAALEKTRSFLNSESTDNTQGKIITVFSNKGGLGKTTIAANLAYDIASITGKRVALVDLNLQLGDVTTFLDITPSFDIAYIVNNINRIDESFLLSSLEKYKNKELYVLADPPYVEQAEDITSEQISTILNLLRTTFAYIIIDTNSSFDTKTLSSLDCSDEILLISMINLPCIRNTQRCLDLFSRLEYPKEKIKLVVNRYIPNEEITIDDVEDTLGHSIYWKLPNNYFTVMSAINRGTPIANVDSESNISQNFKELAAVLTNMVIIKDKQEKKTNPHADLLKKLSIKPFLNKLTQSKK